MEEGRKGRKGEGKGEGKKGEGKGMRGTPVSIFKFSLLE